MNINVQGLKLFNNFSSKAEQNRMERQQKRDNQIAFIENQKHNLKNIQSESIEDIKKKLQMIEDYDNQIAAVKAEYNHEQVFHMLDEAWETGEKIAEAAKEAAPKTPEERKEELIEEATGVEKSDGLLADVTDELEDISDEMEENFEEMENEQSLEAKNLTEQQRSEELLIHSEAKEGNEMSTIRDSLSGSYYDKSDYDFSDYNQNASSFLSGLNINTSTSATSPFSVSDYAMLRNGSYKKLVKAYYAKQKAENAAAGKDSHAKLTSMASNAGTLTKAAQNLMKDSLWQKKQKTTKNEETGEETVTEEYDWDSIGKAVKSFVDSYNRTLDGAADSNTKDVLRSATWMIKTTEVNEDLLNKVGVSVGANNKLEVDEDKLRSSDIKTLKTLFTGYNSFASKMSDKGRAITNAAARGGGSYNSQGRYSDALSSLLPRAIDRKE